MNVIFNWLQAGPYLYSHNNYKNILIYSNIAFIIIALLVIKYKKNYSEHNIKYTLSLLFLIIMGFISAKYHQCQCHDSHTEFKKWIQIDILFSILLGFTFLIFYFKNINSQIILLFAITIILWLYKPDVKNNKSRNIYIITHSLWHILSSVMFFLLIIRD